MNVIGVCVHVTQPLSVGTCRLDFYSSNAIAMFVVYRHMIVVESYFPLIIMFTCITLILNLLFLLIRMLDHICIHKTL